MSIHKLNTLAALAVLIVMVLGWSSPAAALTCPAGEHAVVQRNGTAVCTADKPAPPPPTISCANLAIVDQQRHNALGDESIASNFLAIAKRDLDNAGSAGHYDAAGRVAQWQQAYDAAHNRNVDLTAQEDSIVSGLFKIGINPSHCPGMAQLPPH